MIVNPNNTITLTSGTGTDNQTVTVNTPITNITYSASGATGANVTGLPSGVAYNFASGTITISGTPTETGTFNYTLIVQGSCADTITGRITVNPVPSGINEDAMIRVAVYPNPAFTQFTIAHAPVGSRVRVIDMSGKELLTATITAEIQEISTASLANGVYLVQLEHNGSISQKKLVVNK